MVFRLVIDAARRKWRVGALAIFQLYILVKFSSEVWPATPAMAWTFAGAWFLAIGLGDTFQSREHSQLPVSRRTWWLARWWLSMTAPIVIAQTAVALAFWSSRSQWLSVEQTVLIVTFGVLFCGCGMAIQTTSIGKAGDAPFTLASTGWIFLTIFALCAVPFVVAPLLPQSFSDIGPAWTVVMLAMAAFTLVGYRHTPDIHPRPDMRLARRFNPIPTAPTVQAGAGRPSGFFGRLTGARLVFWEECRKQFFIFAFALAAGVVAWAITSRFRPVSPLAEVLRLAGALPFSSARPTVGEPIVFSALVALATFAETWMLSKVRLLRTLPLSSARLGGLPVGLGLVSASMLFVLLLVLHGLVVRTLPVSLRPDLFIAFAALSATTLTIRFLVGGRSSGWAILGFTPVASIWLGLGFMESWRPDLVQMEMLFGGLLLLLGSWVVMRYALGAYSGMYRPRPGVAT